MPANKKFQIGKRAFEENALLAIKVTVEKHCQAEIRKHNSFIHFLELFLFNINTKK